MKNNATTKESQTLESSDSYKVGKTIVNIKRVFRDSPKAETLDKIILKFMKKDAEKP